MGLSFSSLSISWFDSFKRKIFALAKAEAVLLKSLSIGDTNIEPKLRSNSLKRSEISNQMVTSVSSVIDRSLSFKFWESEVEQFQNIFPAKLKADEIKKSKDHVSLKTSGINRARETASLSIPTQQPYSFLPESLIEFCSPKPKTELDAAATTVQKIYKSYRTRRTLADCAVVIEEFWWRALDYASLKHSSVSFFDNEKPQTAVSRWKRAKNRLAKVGKGLSKDEKAQSLALRHWLEAIDPRHRYGHNLQFYYDVWSTNKSTQPFFFWLDIGEGKEINLEKCPRSKLQQQCITYLGPKERENYEVLVDNGKLVYKKTEIPVNTTECSKWIFVLSTSRALYVGQKKKGSFQHSSFLAGGATTAAGRLVSEEGVLKAIWPYSGHYLPTEENFREFISFLQEHNVDLSNVKRHSIDDDDYPSLKSKSIELETEFVETRGASVEAQSTIEVAEAEEHKPDTSIDENNINNTMALELNKRLSCKWTTAAGARIGCVRDYPAELQSRALEHVNLSPRVVPPPAVNKVPIPSPRPSPTMRLSPSLQYIGMPVPSPQSSLKTKVSAQLQYIGIPIPTVSLTLPNHRRG